MTTLILVGVGGFILGAVVVLLVGAFASGDLG
jgi:hypothetical protein